MAANTPTYIIAGLVCLQVGSATIDAGKLILWHQNPDPITGSGVAPEVVAAGETVQVEWSLVKKIDCPGSSSRVWRGGRNFLVIESSRPTTIPQSDKVQDYSIATQIPDNAPVGPLELTIQGNYDCGDILGTREFILGPVLMEVVE